MTTDELLAAFYADSPQHIAGTSSRATNTVTGEVRDDAFLDSEGTRAFLTWLVAKGHRRRAVVERAWLAYHNAAPDDFPLPFPWTCDE